jgi:hypothetical protein
MCYIGYDVEDVGAPLVGALGSGRHEACPYGCCGYDEGSGYNSSPCHSLKFEHG